MATEKAANNARDKFFKSLFDEGVHALQVDVEADGESFYLIAHVPRGFKKKLPATLVVGKGQSEVEVPLAVKKSEPFKPE